MDTLVKFCLVGLIIGAWFSEYVAKPLIQAMGHLLSAAYTHIKVLGYKLMICHCKLHMKLQEVHPMLLFTLLVGLCILLIQERTERNALFIKQNPTVVVSNWSIIP